MALSKYCNESLCVCSLLNIIISLFKSQIQISNEQFKNTEYENKTKPTLIY